MNAAALSQASTNFRFYFHDVFLSDVILRAHRTLICQPHADFTRAVTWL